MRKAMALLFSWLALLSVGSWQPVFSEQLVVKPIKGHEVSNWFDLMKTFMIETYLMIRMTMRVMNIL